MTHSVLSRNPATHPLPGDEVTSYNDLLDIYVTRIVYAVNGCRVSFILDGIPYSCCIGIWKALNKNRKV